MFLIPFIKSTILERRTLFTTSISFNGEIISLDSCYIKKGLVYITITALFSCQSFFYLECTKVNTCLLCNVRLVSLNKYIFLCRYTRLCAYYSFLAPYLIYYRVLGLIYC